MPEDGHSAVALTWGSFVSKSVHAVCAAVTATIAVAAGVPGRRCGAEHLHRARRTGRASRRTSSCLPAPRRRAAGPRCSPTTATPAARRSSPSPSRCATASRACTSRSAARAARAASSACSTAATPATASRSWSGWRAGPWSNGRVGIIGHSYGGLTAMFTAGEHPPHLDTVVASGLIDDLYRGIVYPGGVPNLGFPLIWPYAYRPAVDVATGTVPGIADPQCLANLATRQAARRRRRSARQRAGRSYTDGPWWLEHSVRRNVGDHGHPGVRRPRLAGRADRAARRAGGLRAAVRHDREALRRRQRRPRDQRRRRGRRARPALGVDPALRRRRAQRHRGAGRRCRCCWRTSTARRGARSKARTSRCPRRSGAATTCAPAAASTTAPSGCAGGLDELPGRDGAPVVELLRPEAGGEITAAAGPDEASVPHRSGHVAEDDRGPDRRNAARRHDGDRHPAADQRDRHGRLRRAARRGARRRAHLPPARDAARVVPRARRGALAAQRGKGEIIRPEHPFINPEPVMPGRVMRMDIEVFPVAHVLRPGPPARRQVLRAAVHGEPLRLRPQPPAGAQHDAPQRAPGARRCCCGSSRRRSCLRPSRHAASSWACAACTRRGRPSDRYANDSTSSACATW